MASKILQTYLRFWAKRYLARVKPKIVAVTGSVGKTSTKDAIFEVLKTEFGSKVRKSEGNLNTETGVPLAILNYKKAPSNIFAWIPILISAPFKSWFLKIIRVFPLPSARHGWLYPKPVANPAQNIHAPRQGL